MVREQSTASSAAGIAGSYKNEAFVPDDEVTAVRYVGTLCEIDLRSGIVAETGKNVPTGASSVEVKRLSYDDALDMIGRLIERLFFRMGDNCNNPVSTDKVSDACKSLYFSSAALSS